MTPQRLIYAGRTPQSLKRSACQHTVDHRGDRRPSREAGHDPPPAPVLGHRCHRSPDTQARQAYAETHQPCQHNHTGTMSMVSGGTQLLPIGLCFRGRDQGAHLRRGIVLRPHAPTPKRTRATIGLPTQTHDTQCINYIGFWALSSRLKTSKWRLGCNIDALSRCSSALCARPQRSGSRCDTQNVY